MNIVIITVKTYTSIMQLKKTISATSKKAHQRGLHLQRLVTGLENVFNYKVKTAIVPNLSHRNSKVCKKRDFEYLLID